MYVWLEPIYSNSTSMNLSPSWPEAISEAADVQPYSCTDYAIEMKIEVHQWKTAEKRVLDTSQYNRSGSMWTNVPARFRSSFILFGHSILNAIPSRLGFTQRDSKSLPWAHLGGGVGLSLGSVFPSRLGSSQDALSVLFNFSKSLWVLSSQLGVLSKTTWQARADLIDDPFQVGLGGQTAPSKGGVKRSYF